MTEAEEILAAAAEQRLYFVFAGADYYPSGGASDYIGTVTCSTDTQAIEMAGAMAKGAINVHERSWWQVARFRLNNGVAGLEVVDEGDAQVGGYREIPS